MVMAGETQAGIGAQAGTGTLGDIHGITDLTGTGTTTLAIGMDGEILGTTTTHTTTLLFTMAAGTTDITLTEEERTDIAT